ncbi:MAG: hypothetical protein C0467_29000 [Planctomycetaceae bacterium]|nr:hypothetical protein [Planctomycetaceae bacterium]
MLLAAANSSTNQQLAVTVDVFKKWPKTKRSALMNEVFLFDAATDTRDFVQRFRRVGLTASRIRQAILDL